MPHICLVYASYLKETRHLWNIYEASMEQPVVYLGKTDVEVRCQCWSSASRGKGKHIYDPHPAGNGDK